MEHYIFFDATATSTRYATVLKRDPGTGRVQQILRPEVAWTGGAATLEAAILAEYQVGEVVSEQQIAAFAATNNLRVAKFETDSVFIGIVR